MSIERYIQVDDEGYFSFDGQRVDDAKYGKDLLGSLRVDENQRYIASLRGQDAYVEAFDAPLIARHVRVKDGELGQIDLAYGATAEFKWESLLSDEWDRFHGVTLQGVPFVLSRGAQVEFFDLLDGFDDDSITIRGRTFNIAPWLTSRGEVNSQGFWTNIYQTEKPGWEMGRETPILPEILPQLKLTKARVLVLGCGSGHDAAFFAQAGHVVTGVDFSPEALGRAKDRYGRLENLSLVQADAFQLPPAWTGRFDVVFEHTCFCAVDPGRRKDLVNQWRRVLSPQGHLLGIFFVTEKRDGPYFGGSEWEVRERLRKSFDFMFWTRWRRSVEGRQGKELVVYARKKD
jgi:SAM-dependent methyltransferase